jgi:hypothetical protein
MTRNRLSHWMESPWAWMVLAAFSLLVIAAASRWPSDARADVTEEPAQKQFLSGGARSEIVLREISETLKRIDGRLERMENAVRAAGDAGREPADKEKESTDK